VRQGDKGDDISFSPRRPISPSLLCFLVRRVLTAKTTELLELQPLRRFLLVFCGGVVAVFTIATLQNDVVSHNFITR
jgi:multisubunit Na+/H+ antiporter MnhB subunit